jgi:hypothetical protein
VIVIGIDPGLNGGIAFLDIDKLVLSAIRTPVFRPSKKFKRKTTTYDIETLVSLFDISITTVHCAILEKVNTMPGQGIASNGKLMYGYGLMHGLIAKFNHKLLLPRVWKKKMGLSSDKELSRKLASEVFPLCAQLWHTKNRDGVAEAALLASTCIESLNTEVDLRRFEPCEHRNIRNRKSWSHVP